MFRMAIKAALLLSAPSVLALAQESGPAGTSVSAPQTVEKARVFITDSQSWEMRGSAGGANGAFAGHSQGGARPQTAEIIKTFGQRCPDVIVNNKQELADYIVVLDHEGGKGYLQHRNKVAVFEQTSGDVVVSHSTLSLGGSVEEACKGIVTHWAAHSKDILAAKQRSITPAAIPTATHPAPDPVAPSALQSPQSQVMVTVDSTPQGADIEVDGSFVGSTPSTMSLSSGSHEVTVKKKGFGDWNRKLSVTTGSIRLIAELEQKPGE
jgi:hypothetical protein